MRGSPALCRELREDEAGTRPSYPRTLLNHEAHSRQVRSLTSALQGDPRTSGPAFIRHGDLSVNAAMVVGCCVLMWTMAQGIDLIAVASVVAVLLALLAWPAMVRRYASWRDGRDRDEDRVRQPSPDAGHTALGWVLLGLGLFTLTGALTSVVGSGSSGDSAMPGTLLAASARDLLGTPLVRDLAWWALPLAVAQLWAALELLAVSSRRWLVANLWGAAAVIVAVAANAGHLRALVDAPLAPQARGLTGMLMLLTPAVATLLLVNRQSLPKAIARMKRA